jgi:hypothetical protein
MPEISDQEAKKALSEISATISPVAVRAEGIASACPIYKTVKPLLEQSLPYIERLNRNVADAIRFLIKLADTACP